MRRISIILTLFLLLAFAKNDQREKNQKETLSLINLLPSSFGGGPDSFGYLYESTQDPGDTVGFEWIDPSQGEVLILDDDDLLTRSLPFPFPYYEEDLTSINICSNGFLQFPTSWVNYLNYPLPYPQIRNMIAGFWDDLDPSAGGTVYHYNDPNGQFTVFAWVDVPRYGTQETQTFEIVFYSDGRMKFNYLDMNGNLSSNTIGIQGRDGSGGYFLQYVYNGDPPNHILTDSTSVIWYLRQFGNDGGIRKIHSPLPFIPAGEITPRVKVKNYGRNPASFFVKIEFEGLLRDSLAVGPLPSNDTALVIFPSRQLSPGIYNFKAWVSLPGDENPRNDTLSRQVFAVHFLDSLEISNGNLTPDPPYNAWEWGSPTVGPQPHSGIRLWGTVLGGEYENYANWKLTSPIYTANIDNPYLFFWHWYSTEYYFDGGNVKISTDGGNTWQILYPEPPDRYDTIASSGNSGIPYEPCYSGYSGLWKFSAFRLPVSQNQNFQIRWHFGTDLSIVSYGWYLDDLGGYGFQPTTKVEEFVAKGLKSSRRGTFLNSPSLSLEISLAKPSGLSLKVISPSGPILFQKELGFFSSGSQRISISLPPLPNGLYFLSLGNGEEEVVKKFIFLR